MGGLLLWNERLSWQHARVESVSPLPMPPAAPSAAENSTPVDEPKVIQVNTDICESAAAHMNKWISNWPVLHTMWP